MPDRAPFVGLVVVIVGYLLARSAFGQFGIVVVLPGTVSERGRPPGDA
jgi:hypothetical protein